MKSFDIKGVDSGRVQTGLAYSILYDSVSDEVLSQMCHVWFFKSNTVISADIFLSLLIQTNVLETRKKQTRNYHMNFLNTF